MNITEVIDENISLCNCTDNNNDLILEISPLTIFIISIIPCLLSLFCGLIF